MSCCNVKPPKRIMDENDALVLKYKSGRIMKIHKDDIISYSMNEYEMSISLPTGYRFNVNRGILTNYDEAIKAIVRLKGL